ncbi:MAG: fibrobacter succinogenes major paralogous domain-containing protein, partial [Flammeovirgaceae bacterium]
SQEWLGKNLNVDRFANGDPIPEARTDEEWKLAGKNKQPAWCYYNNDPAKGRTYGKLYNWYAVHDPRSLAPSGWHVPNDEELKTLVTNTTDDDLRSSYGWRGRDGRNRSGFAGLPGGGRNPDGTFSYLREVGTWWSSTESGEKAGFWYLMSNSSVRYITNKTNGYSVRCIKD